MTPEQMKIGMTRIGMTHRQLGELSDVKTSDVHNFHNNRGYPVKKEDVAKMKITLQRFGVKFP